MRVETREVFKLEELSEDARQKAFSDYQQQAISWELPWMGETCNSLKELFEKCWGIDLKDWELGAYSRSNYVEFEFYQDEVGELSGGRAMAWLENNLLGHMRKDWTLKNIDDKYTSVHGKYARRYTKPGALPACPFTGYGVDDDLIYSLNKDIQNGDTLKEAFSSLADVVQRALEAECEYQQSEEAFEQWAEDVEFLESGSEV